MLSLFTSRRNKNKLQKLKEQFSNEEIGLLFVEVENFISELEAQVMGMDISSLLLQLSSIRGQLINMLSRFETISLQYDSNDIKVIIEHLNGINKDLLAIE